MDFRGIDGFGWNLLEVSGILVKIKAKKIGNSSEIANLYGKKVERSWKTAFFFEVLPLNQLKKRSFILKPHLHFHISGL